MKLVYLLLSVIVEGASQLGEDVHKIQLGEKLAPELMNETQVLNLIKNGQHFFDLTNQPQVSAIQMRMATPLPTKLSYEAVVRKAQSKIDKKTMTTFLTKFSSFPNRYYANPNGLKAASYLLEQVRLAGKGFPGKFSAKFFNHTWLQPSVVARLEGRDYPEEIVVVGAHLDSINLDDPMNGIAPGADDDGSGTTSVLEALRSLAKSGFQPSRTVEFQFYAAEEVGLRGSQDIANKYAKAKKNIIGMMQLDMTGYNVNKRIQLLTDFTDKDLTQFLRILIDKYLTFKWFNNKCGYACSDHASYNKAGFRSANPAEDILNDRLHTTSDTMQFVDMNNVAEYTRLAISFIVELAFPTAKTYTSRD